MAGDRRGRRSDPEAPPPDALETALRLLTLRPHSAVELRRKLRRRGCPEEAVDAALERVQELGYQSDQEFAEVLVRGRATKRGRRAVAADLARRGIDREVAGAALAELTPELELEAARKTAGAMPDLEPARLGGRLQRRGFSGATVRALVRERALGGDQEGPGD